MHSFATALCSGAVFGLGFVTVGYDSFYSQAAIVGGLTMMVCLYDAWSSMSPVVVDGEHGHAL